MTGRRAYNKTPMSRLLLLVWLPLLAAWAFAGGAQKQNDLWQSCAAAPQKQCLTELAKQSANNIGDEAKRAKALSQLAGEQAASGDVEAAKQTTAQIKDAEQKAVSLARIAGAQADAGDISGAKQTIKDAITAMREIRNALNINEPSMREIAIAQAKAGEVEKAKANVFLISSPENRGLAARGIMLAQWKSGDIEGARKTARIVDYPKQRAMALRALSIKQAKDGDIKGAIQTAQLIGDDDDEQKAAALSGILKLLGD